MIIDTHHHWLPKTLIDNAERYIPKSEGYSVRRMTYPSGEEVVQIMLENLAHTTLRYRRSELDVQLKHMDEAGVDLAVLSIATMQDFTTLDMARLVNDALAKVCKEDPDRFMGMAAIPIGQDGWLDELDRAVKDLGLKAVCITTHHRGMYPGHEIYRPLYQKCSQLKVPVFVHAAGVAPEYKIFKRFRTHVNVGRGLDHTVAVVDLLYSGMPGDFPNMRWLHGHLGGFFFSRIRWFITDNMMAKHVFLDPQSPFKGKLPPFQDYLKTQFFDTGPAAWTKAEVECAVEDLSADRVIYGSDYPAGDDDWMLQNVKLIRSLEITSEEKEKIFSRNVAPLFGVKS